MKVIEEYSKFKIELASLCERGKISKDTKKAFSHYAETLDPGKLIYAVCSDLTLLFERSPIDSKEYAAVCAAAVDMIFPLKRLFVNLDRHFAVVCAFLRLTVKANARPTPSLFKIVNAGLREYHESLQNIKYGLRLFE